MPPRAKPLKKCAKPSCPRLEAIRGHCRVHYTVMMKQAGMPIGMVDSAAATQHVRKLGEAGVGTPRLSELTGLAPKSLWDIGAGKSAKILARSEAKILAVPVPNRQRLELLAGGVKVSAIGSQRRIQALRAIGYSVPDLEQHLGIDGRTIRKLGTQKFVTVKLAQTIADIFEKLQLVPGGCDKARERAAKNGWVPPLAWDEGSIDDPDAEPDRGRRGRAVDWVGWYEDYLYLKDIGLDDHVIADRMGLTLDGLDQRVRRWLKQQET